MNSEFKLIVTPSNNGVFFMMGFSGSYIFLFSCLYVVINLKFDKDSLSVYDMDRNK